MARLNIKMYYGMSRVKKQISGKRSIRVNFNHEMLMLNVKETKTFFCVFFDKFLLKKVYCIHDYANEALLFPGFLSRLLRFSNHYFLLVTEFKVNATPYSLDM